MLPQRQRALALRFLPALLLLVAVVCSEDAAADSATECKNRCVGSAATCRQPNAQGLNNCNTLHGCNIPDCDAVNECRYGCAVCKKYWTHFITQCNLDLADCTRACEKATSST